MNEHVTFKPAITEMEEYLFDLPDRGTAKIQVDGSVVRERLKAIVEDEDLRKYIL